jgi:hypothetical protein
MLTVPDDCLEAVVATHADIDRVFTAAMVAAETSVVPAGRVLRVWLVGGGTIAGGDIAGNGQVTVGPGSIVLRELNGQWVIS